MGHHDGLTAHVLSALMQLSAGLLEGLQHFTVGLFYHFVHCSQANVDKLFIQRRIVMQGIVHIVRR